MLLLFNKLFSWVVFLVSVVRRSVWLEIFLELGKLMVLLIRVMGCKVRDFSMGKVFFSFLCVNKYILNKGDNLVGVD